MDAPAGWVGMTRKRVEETLEAEGGRWRMTGFAPGKIETTQTQLDRIEIRATEDASIAVREESTFFMP